MWQRFTERARRVVFFAQEESARCGTNLVHTEHLLLGLVRENDSLAGRLLNRLGVNTSALRSETERRLERGPGCVGQDMQLTPRSKRAIDLAYEEARHLNHNYIGTEHLLLGLVREDGGAAQILISQGAELDRVRAEVVALTQEEAAQRGQPPAESQPADTQWSPLAGDLGALRNEDGRDEVEVGMNKEAADELWKVMQTKDHHGYREMLSSGRMLRLPAGTEVKLLRAGKGSAFMVRILTGEHEGQVVWVLRHQFQNKGPDKRPFPPPIDEDGQAPSA